MKFQTFIDYVNNFSNINLILIDPLEDIASQGPFDLIFHKETDELVKNDEKSKLIIFNLEKYFKENPKVINIDPIEKEKNLMDRYLIIKLLSEVVEKQLPLECNFRMPKYKLYEKEESIYDLLNIEFPLICKSVLACGNIKSHEMGIVFNEKGMHSFKPPFIVQEFYNHNSTIFKVFVIGDYLYVVKRSSLPNMPSQFNENIPTIFFDSQHPLDTQIEKYKNFIDKPIEEESNELQPPSYETLLKISKAISSALGLSLFGFDVITQVKTGYHAVIDVNYFPDYGGVENFNKIFLDFLISKVQNNNKI
jgi:inositol-1,3,4-trisphosphate 5/6-kinase/inositol-tetrakisphosphate 1-kinase